MNNLKEIDTKNDIKQNSNCRNIIIGGAWPYANNSLHLGHIAGLISGDILARYHRQKGDNVVYVSGTDCHGTPITQRAKQEGRTPKEIAESYNEEFVQTFKAMNFSYNLYGKTEDEFHMKKVQEMFRKMYDNGYIYEKDDNQPYCEKCQKFLSDRELKLTCPNCGNESKGDQCDCGYIPTEEDLDGATCVECGNIVHLRKNKNLYLALTKLQGEIEKYVSEYAKNWRINSQNETNKYLREGLRDRAVTRDLNWGIDIPVEGFDDKKMYVWIDAVLGYITMTQKYCQENGLNWENFWKNGSKTRMYMAHGKDNITFHSIILPGLLIAMEENFKLPDMMVATEYLNINSEKISKSKGNGINVKDIVNEYDVDTLRFFLMANGPERKDSNFSVEDYLTIHNSEITNKYGNLVNRTLRFKGLDEIPNGNMDDNIARLTKDAYQKVSDYIEKTEFKKATAVIMELVEEGNKYYDERKPWEQKREDIDGFNDTIYTCANLIANLSNLFEPFMPNSSKKIREYLGIEEASWQVIGVKPETKVKDIQPLFVKVAKEKTKK
ncbi:MAG: methionine--tRNA ligase [Clostridia bacterium]|nr:methionine--tRNA ligase [Clostridia bacterium]